MDVSLCDLMHIMMNQKISRRSAIKIGLGSLAGTMLLSSGLLSACSSRKRVKLVAINGSPRKDMNTAKLLEQAMAGAEEEGAQAELFHLYDYTFKGCVSCLRCKLKDNDCNGLCAYQDSVSPVLEECRKADILLFGSPVYYDSLDGQMRCFLERLMFPLTPYSVDKDGKRQRFLDKTVPVGAVYAMNAPSPEFYTPMFRSVENYMKMAFGSYEAVYSGNTYQFKDYSLYDVNMIPEESKAITRDSQFPKDLEAAYEMGKNLVKQITL